MAVRFNWNPQDAPDDITADDIEELEREAVVFRGWRCGPAKLEIGERVFLVRTGRGSRGVIGMGRTVSEPDGGFEDEDGEWIPYGVEVCFEVLALEPIVPREVLGRPPLDTVAWSNATAAARLTPTQAAHLEQLVWSARSEDARPAFDLADPEMAYVDTGEVAGRNAVEFTRRESSLIQRFISAMRADGVSLKAIRFHPPDWPGALRCDLYDPTTRRIIEAKSDCDRQTIRHAIGQLADYARLHGDPCEKVLLLPERPHDDLIRLLESQSVSVMWEQDGEYNRYPDHVA